MIRRGGAHGTRINHQNERINENWIYTAGANADGRMFCSTAAYRRKAPICGCVHKKLLNLFSPFANIFLKCNRKGRLLL
jgi:hypothetical protein